MYKPTAFLSIEKAMTVPVAELASAIGAHAERALREVYQDHVGTDEILRNIDLSDVGKLVRKRLPFIAKQAYLFGAAQVTGDPKTTVAYRDPYPMDLITNVVDLHAQIVTDVALAAFVDDVQKLLVEARSPEQKSDAVKVIKFNLADALNSAVDNNTRVLPGIAANLTTSRLVSYGFLAEAKKRGITKYQLEAILDARTSDVCRLVMNGRIFDVDPAYAKTELALMTTDPAALKVIAPFIRSTRAEITRLRALTDEELQAEGKMIPPFHPFCRTIPVLLGEVDTNRPFSMTAESSIYVSPANVTVANPVTVGGKPVIPPTGPAPAPPPPHAPSLPPPVSPSSGLGLGPNVTAPIPKPKPTPKPPSPVVVESKKIFNSGAATLDGEQGSNVYEKWYERWSPYHRYNDDAINLYTGAGYRPMNGYLRNPGSTYSDNSHVAPLVTQMIDRIRATKIPHAVVGYRGVGNTYAVFKGRPEDLIGRTFVDDGFMSWSVKQEIARENFTYTQRDNVTGLLTRYVLRTKLSKGTNAVPGTSFERELVLAPGQKYQILGVTDGGTAREYNGQEYHVKFVEIKLVSRRLPRART